MSEEKKLTKKELRFCEYYLVSFNGTKAAIQAKYSKKCAAEIAYENLRKPHIKNHIAQRTEEILSDIGVNQRRVIEEYARIAFFNPKKIFDDKGNVKPVHQLDDATSAVLAAIELSEVEVSTVKRTTTSTQTRKVKFVPKETALAILMKYLGLSSEKIDITSKGKELQGLTDKVIEVTLNLV